jgi:hypothetical protein
MRAHLCGREVTGHLTVVRKWLRSFYSKANKRGKQYENSHDAQRKIEGQPASGLSLSNDGLGRIFTSLLPKWLPPRQEGQVIQWGLEPTSVFVLGKFRGPHLLREREMGHLRRNEGSSLSFRQTSSERLGMPIEIHDCTGYKQGAGTWL